MCVNPSAEGGKRPRARFPGDQWPPKEVEAVICLVIRSIVPFTGGEKKEGTTPHNPGPPITHFFYQALIAGHSARLVKSLAKETAIINIYIYL